ncbi:MAG TPA: LysR family transcriptional regulator [Alphaproteobacteria bacterium]
MAPPPLELIAIFAAVVERGSFSGAARALGISKSAVSKSVAALERRFGARLLNRTTRRLSLTEAGAALDQRAQRILAEAEAAEQDLGRLSAAPRGRLKVSAPMSFGNLHLAAALPEFLQRHPELSLDLNFSDRQVDLVEEGFDVAIRIGTLADSSLVARKLANVRRVVAASPGYWRRHGTPRHPRDLKDHNCLLYAYLSSGDTWRFRGPSGPVAVRVSGNYRANNGEALTRAAAAGLGVVVMPVFILAEDLAAGRVTTALDGFVAAEPALYAVTPPGRAQAPKVRAFIDFMVEWIGPTPPWERMPRKRTARS